MPPETAYAPEHARVFVEASAKLSGVELDYTLPSLEFVIGLLDSFGEPGSDATAETVFSAGCYVGETLVRSNGYRWVDAPDDLFRVFGFRIVVGPGGIFANPIGKAFNLVDNGLEDSVRYFAQTQIAADQRAAGGTPLAGGA